MTTDFIDKLAFLYLKDNSILMTRSFGNDTFYIPGGKREAGETDQQALIREVKEELSVNLDPNTIKYYNTFKAQAHGKPIGTLVRMTCYFAQPDSVFKIGSEIEEIDYFTYAQKHSVGPVDQLIFEDLYQHNLIK